MFLSQVVLPVSMNTFFAEACRFLPVVRRTRGFHLYTPDAQRYLDLFLARGSAVLGHACPDYGLVLKNAISQSMYVPYPNLWERRLYAALRRLFPQYQARIFFQNPCPQVVWREPWSSCKSAGEHAFWRPGLPAPAMRYVAVVLPVSYQPCWVVLTQDHFAINMPDEIPIPAMLARLLLKALRYWPQADSLPEMPLKWKKIFSRHAQVYRRYFFSELSPDIHKKLYEEALQRKIILPPQPLLAGALPMQMSQGEEKLLEEVLA